MASAVDTSPSTELLNICLSEIILPNTFDALKCFTRKNDGPIARLEKLAMFQAVNNAFEDPGKLERLKALVVRTNSLSLSPLLFSGHPSIIKLLIHTYADKFSQRNIFVEPTVLSISIGPVCFKSEFAEGELPMDNLYMILDDLLMTTSIMQIRLHLKGSAERVQEIMSRLRSIVDARLPHLALQVLGPQQAPRN